MGTVDYDVFLRAVSFHSCHSCLFALRRDYLNSCSKIYRVAMAPCHSHCFSGKEGTKVVGDVSSMDRGPSFWAGGRIRNSVKRLSLSAPLQKLIGRLSKPKKRRGEIVYQKDEFYTIGRYEERNRAWWEVRESVDQVQNNW